VIRVWIETLSAVTRAGFESLLDSDPRIEVVSSLPEADVTLREGLPGASDGAREVPTVVLTDSSVSMHALRGSVRAILPWEAPIEQIVAALFAASAGLVAIPAELNSRATSVGTQEDVEPLTPRELEALEMLAEGLSNKQIASRLNISEHTAKFHVNAILSKLHAGTRTEAVIRGIRSGIVKV